MRRTVEHIPAQPYPMFVGTGDDFDRLEAKIMNTNQHHIRRQRVGDATQSANQHRSDLGQLQTQGQCLRQHRMVRSGVKLSRNIRQFEGRGWIANDEMNERGGRLYLSVVTVSNHPGPRDYTCR